MPTMLPTAPDAALTLADVLPACRAAIAGKANPFELPAVRQAVVLLVDGLGAAALRIRSGHARTLAGAMTRRDVILSGFPTTTAAALASLCTGARPGRHGLVGYTVLDGAHDRVVNQLSGWDARLEPATWQRLPTLFEQVAADGLRASIVGPPKYAGSGFTAAVLRGADYHPAKTLDERFAATRRVLDEGRPGIVYLYVPELDMTAHASGWESGRWTDQLETLDAAVRRFAASLGPDEGLLVTADHGVLDVPTSSHVLIDEQDDLVDGVRHVAGDPRCLQLHLEPDADRDALVEAWRAREGRRAWVATREEAIDAGWFGEVDAAVLPRIGDVLIAARGLVAYYDGRTSTAQGRAMIGQHGSWTPEETRVPLLRFGAFARR